jgi:hypothetical protein
MMTVQISARNSTSLQHRSMKEMALLPKIEATHLMAFRTILKSRKTTVSSSLSGEMNLFRLACRWLPLIALCQVHTWNSRRLTQQKSSTLKNQLFCRGCDHVESHESPRSQIFVSHILSLQLARKKSGVYPIEKNVPLYLSPLSVLSTTLMPLAVLKGSSR